MPSVAMTWINQGIDRNLRLRLNKGVTLGDLFLGAYVNSHTPNVADTNANYTECTDGGYSEIDLTGATWSGTTTGGVATYTYPSVTFFFTGTPGPQTVYGVFYKDQAGNIAAAALLTTPYVIPPSGGSLTIDLTAEGQQC